MGNRNRSFGDLMFGLLLGGAVGYVAALLNAPRPGTETREMLNQRTREIRDRAYDTFSNTKDKANKVVETGLGKVERTVSRTKETATETANRFQEQGTDYVTQKRVEVSEGLRKVADSVDPNVDIDTDDMDTHSGGMMS